MLHLLPDSTVQGITSSTGLIRKDRTIMWTEKQFENKTVLEDAIETYALINTHTVYINSPNVVQGMGRDKIANDQFRFEIARVWFAKCRALNGRSSIHYPFCRSTRNRSIYSLIYQG